MTTPIVARAMSAQVSRVNGSPSRLAERIAELEAEVARLQALLQAAAARSEGRDELPNAERGTRHFVSAGGRELITPAAAAKAHGCSVATINRALNGWGNYQLEGVRLPNGRWLVYADAPLHRPHRRRQP